MKTIRVGDGESSPIPIQSTGDRCESDPFQGLSVRSSPQCLALCKGRSPRLDKAFSFGSLPLFSSSSRPRPRRLSSAPLPHTTTPRVIAPSTYVCVCDPGWMARVRVRFRMNKSPRPTVRPVPSSPISSLFPILTQHCRADFRLTMTIDYLTIDQRKDDSSFDLSSG
jgi:hypothetical protein